MSVRSVYVLTVLVTAAALALPASRGWALECGDLDSNGSIAATDALLLLRNAVGQSVTLMCPAGGLRPPATGQTTTFGPGSDGDVQAGAALSYTDNGDGTITDNNTGLMWEKKDDSGGIHDQDNVYTWSTGSNNMDGTLKTVFLDTLNDVAGGGTNCFAGRCDWRIPSLKELQSIVDSERFDPAIDPAFHQPATCTGCSDVTLASCSCTKFTNTNYWSSTTDIDPAFKVWTVFFHSGFVPAPPKTDSNSVRAVRGGL